MPWFPTRVLEILLEEIRVLGWGIYSDSTLKVPPLENETLGQPLFIHFFVSSCRKLHSFSYNSRPSEQSGLILLFQPCAPTCSTRIFSPDSGADSLFPELPFHHPSFSSHRESIICPSQINLPLLWRRSLRAPVGHSLPLVWGLGVPLASDLTTRVLRFPWGNAFIKTESSGWSPPRTRNLNFRHGVWEITSPLRREGRWQRSETMDLEDVLWEPWLLESSVPFSPILFHQQSVTLFWNF